MLSGRADPDALIAEVHMLQIQAPMFVLPTAEARHALGVHLHAAGLAAYREIAFAAKGLEIAHLQFVFRGLTLAACSRVRRDGIVEIEMGLGDPRLPRSCFTAAQMRQAEAATRARTGAARRGQPGKRGHGLPVGLSTERHLIRK
jgi:hypothetical protein